MSHTLKLRVGAKWFNHTYVYNRWYWYSRALMKLSFIRNPKIYDWEIGFQYGEQKGYRTQITKIVPDFKELYDVRFFVKHKTFNISL